MRAIVLGGGGAQCAYEVGALLALSEQGAPWTLGVGSSGGAINVAQLAAYRPEQRATAALRLAEGWYGLRPSMLHRRRYLQTVFRKGSPSLYDDSPGRAYLRRVISRQAILDSGWKLRIVAVDLDDGSPVLAKEYTAQLVDYVIASSRVPGVYPWATVCGRRLVDGGLRYVVPIRQAVLAGANEIDVIACDPIGKVGQWNVRRPNLVQYLGRAIELAMSTIGRGNFREAGLQNQIAELVKRYEAIRFRVVAPDSPLASHSLDFSPQAIRANMGRGRADARALLQR